METKLSVNEMIPIRDELGHHSMLEVPSVGRSEGLALLWKDDITINTQTYSLNHIDVKIMTPLQVEWRLNGVYGHPGDQRKKETWALLQHFHSRASMSWVCIGNFNEILTFYEKSGGVPMKHGCVSGFGCRCECECGCGIQQFLKKMDASAVGLGN